MENRQINFFKSKDFNTALKPFKKGTVVKIDSFDIRENQKELKIGLFGWYAICPSKELKKNKLYYFSLYDEPLVLYRDENQNVRCIKNICPHRGASFFGGTLSDGVITCPYHGAKFSSGGSCQNLDRITCSHIVDNNYDNYAKRIHLSQYKTSEKNGYIFVHFSKKSETDLNNISEDTPISNYLLYENGFSHKDYVFEEVLVDFKCDWSRIIENHLDILHIFWVHGDTIPDKDVNKNVLVSFNQKININPKYIESIYYYKNDPTKEFIRIKYIPPGRILIYKGDPSSSRYLQVLDHIPLGNNKARVIVRHYRKFLQNKLLNNLLLFKETQRKIFYKIFDEDYMILKTQTYNHDMGFINNDEIKLLGEDRIINYFWKWYKKSEDKDEPWKIINKTQNLDVYDKVILKYPPEIKKLEIINNIDIIRKTFVRFAAPLIFFMLII
ncbi:MAG: aromatic ring-hydroxylating dioxygenase subunit alpha [Prochlorococcus marinus CUG1435]|nr:aromatic ring-hydroxylating dioxygenase subunit alpha [Prochlorococcus marinus CUG1435]